MCSTHPIFANPYGGTATHGQAAFADPSWLNLRLRLPTPGRRCLQSRARLRRQSAIQLGLKFIF